MEVVVHIYRKFGILNMFSPYHPNGTYRLDMGKFDEKCIAKILCELCKSEGWTFMTDIKLRGEKHEKLNPDIIRNLGDSGVLECNYKCPDDKEKVDLREKQGAKYLEW